MNDEELFWERKRQERILQEEFQRMKDKSEGVQPMNDKVAGLITIGSIVVSAVIMFL